MPSGIVASGLHLAQRAKVVGEVAGGGQGVGVIAQDPSAAVQSVLVQVAGGQHVAERGQVDARLLAEVRVLGCGPRLGRVGGRRGYLRPGRGRQSSAASSGVPRRTCRPLPGIGDLYRGAI